MLKAGIFIYPVIPLYTNANCILIRNTKSVSSTEQGGNL